MSIFLFSPLMSAYMLIMIFFAGACAGSFINCAQIRLSNKSGSILGRSACPNCGRRLGFFDLIPIFSWLFLGGKCRYCKSKISFRYFAVEMIFGLMWCGLLARFGLSLITLEYIILFTFLATEALSDIATQEVPDRLHIACLAVFLVFLAAHESPVKRLITGVITGLAFGCGVLIISLLMEKVCQKETLGGADIKLLAVLGLYFGPAKMLFLLILSCILGLISALLTKSGLSKTFPFIPAITLGAYITAMSADPLIKMYLGLFGFGHTH